MRHKTLPACRRLLFPLFPRATKEIGDVCTQANIHDDQNTRFQGKEIAQSFLFTAKIITK